MKFLAALVLPVALSAAFISPHANAQVVYRCGSVYSQIPCGDGRIVEATDPRTAAQRAEAKRVVADERRLADSMRHDRIADQVRPVGASSLGGAASPVAKHEPANPHRAKKKRLSAKQPVTDDFVAFDPSSRKKSSKN